MLRTFLICLLLATPAAAQQKASPSDLPSEDTVMSFLHDTFGYDPSIMYKVAEIKPSAAPGVAEVTIVVSGTQGPQQNKLYVSSDGKHALIGDLIPFGAHPFAADAAKLKESAKGPSRGPANAPVEIVEFSDLQCPHCKDAQPKIEKLMSDDKNARLVYQNYPLPMHDWASKGAAYADCIGRSNNDAFWKFIQGVYDAQSDITASNADDKLKAIANTAGAKGDETAACAAKADTQARVQNSVDLARAMDVNSTPTLFINGRRISNLGQLPDEVFKSLVDFAAQEAGGGQKSTK